MLDSTGLDTNAYNVISNTASRKTPLDADLEDAARMARYRLELGPVPLHHQVYLDLGRRPRRRRVEAGRPGADRARPGRALRLQPDHRPSRARRTGPRAAPRADAWSRHLRPPSAHRPRLRGPPLVHRGDAAPRDGAVDPGHRRPAGVGRRRRRAALGLEPGSPILYLERLRLADGEPLLLEQVHLPAERFPGLLASDLERGSLYDLLSDRYGTRVAKARELLEPILLPAREARLLGRKRGAPALLIEGIAATADGTPVEFGRTYVRGDRTRYYVERVVVRPRWITRGETEGDSTVVDELRPRGARRGGGAIAIPSGPPPPHPRRPAAHRSSPYLEE